MNRLTTNTFLFIWLSLMLFSCRSPEACDKNNATPRDLSQIMDRDTLVAVTSTNSTDYFVYRGKPMGFHLELLEKFTEHIGVELQVIVENNIDKSISLIQQGKADVLAQSLTISNFRKTKIAFTIPITETKQVLVQRICDTMITSTLDLGHRTIYIQKSSVFNDRLINLSNERSGYRGHRDVHDIRVHAAHEQGKTCARKDPDLVSRLYRHPCLHPVSRPLLFSDVLRPATRSCPGHWSLWTQGRKGSKQLFFCDSGL